MTLIKDDVNNKTKEVNAEISITLNGETKVIEIETKKKNKKAKPLDQLVERVMSKGKLSDAELFKLTTNTIIGQINKKIVTSIIYKLGNSEDYLSTELDLIIEVDYNKGHCIVFGQNKFVAEDFRKLYKLFNTTIEKVFKIIEQIYGDKNEVKEIEKNKQLAILEDIENVDSLFVHEIGLSIKAWSNYDQEIKDLKLVIATMGDNFQALKFGTNTYLTKSDLYVIYRKFDLIIQQALESERVYLPGTDEEILFLEEMKLQTIEKEIENELK